MWSERGLTRPNGEMLFSYRIKKAEYLSLRGLLAHKLESLHGHPWTFDSAAESACFVLYAAEWWRREYKGGPWRWTHILDSIGPVYSLEPYERTHGVERGLKAWGHRVSYAGKKYLGAIVAQGGLPLQLIAQGDGSITRLLSRGLGQAQLYGWDASRLEAFFEAHGVELVQHLRDEGIYRLLASVVQTVLALRQECQLAGVSNPVEVLDRQQPNWRERFPLSVDDNSAEPLLLDLVREAARVVKPVTAFPVLVTRSLRLQAGGETYELGMNIEMPACLTVAALAAACGMGIDHVPQVFSLELQGEERVILGDGRQLLGGSEPSVMLSGRSRRLLSAAAVCEQLLVLRGMGADLHEPVNVPGAEALDPEQPWVFACKDAGEVLVGVGSVRLPESRCLIVVKDGQDVLSADGCNEAVFKGILSGIEARRRVYEVNGAVRLPDADGDFLIQTGQITDLCDQLVWRGRRASYFSRPLPVYQGVPQLYRLTEEGALRSVLPQEIVWVEAIKNGARIAQVKLHRGPVDAWLMKDGVRQRRFRMVLVSPDARIRFKSGDSAKQGVIEFHGWGLDSLAGPDALTKDVDVQSTLARLELSAADRPPVNVRVAVAWPCSALTQILELPFPSTGGRFSGLNGDEIVSGSSLSFRLLHNTRVQVFDRNPDAPRRYTLSIELQSTQGPGGLGRLCSEHNVAIDMQGFGEIRLLELESTLLGMMSQNDELDARLELRLSSGPSVIAQLFLTRYDAELEQSEMDIFLSDKCLSMTSSKDLAAVTLKALPMLTRKTQEVLLDQQFSSGVPVGRWGIKTLVAREGPWLIYPAKDSTLQLRPMLYSGFLDGSLLLGENERCPLGHAMSVVNQSDRISAIRDVVSKMATDLDHESWQLVTNQYQLLSHLPLSTFDYWRVIAKDMAACLAAVLKMPIDVPALMKRMRDELGVMWELMPRRLLDAGLQQHLKNWARQLNAELSDPFVRTVSEPQFRVISQAESVMGDMVDLVLFQSGFDISERLKLMIGTIAGGPRPVMNQLWLGENCLLQRFLLRTHADTEARFWPSFDLWRELVQSLQELAPEGITKQLQGILRDLLWMPDGPGMKTDVANVPVLAGLLSQCTSSTSWWTSGSRLAQLRQIKNFDPAWFETAFRSGALVGLMLEQTAKSAGSGGQTRTTLPPISEATRYRRAPPPFN